MKIESGHVRCMALVCLIGIAPGAAMAYIDPGNGAYMVQVMFTLIGAAIFYIRHPIQSIKSLWRWLLHRRSNATSVVAETASPQPAPESMSVPRPASEVAQDSM